MRQPLSFARPVRADRRAFSLIEMLVAITLLSLVVGTLMALIVRQQRVQIGTQVLVETRGSVRQALDVLPAELRAISTSGGDVILMEPSRIVFRSVIGHGIACVIDPARTLVTLAPAQTALRNGLAAFLSNPQAGDSVFVFDQGPNPSSAGDVWLPREVTATLGVGVCPMVTGFTQDAAEQANGISFTVDTPLPPTVEIGAPVSFFRLASYELYQASDGRYYLGYSCTGCGERQPVSGPYTADGIQFVYRDTLGNVAADPLSVHRIELMVQAQSETDLSRTGVANGYYTYRRAAQVAVRNIR